MLFISLFYMFIFTYDHVFKLDYFFLTSLILNFFFRILYKIYIENNNKTMNLNKRVRPEVPSIRFVKLSAKIISAYLSNYIINM